MIVYIEDCLIENFFVTLLLLLVLNKVYKFHAKKYSLIFSSLMGAVFACFYPLLHSRSILLLYKFCAGFLIVYLFSGKERILLKYFSFIFLTACFGGINILVYYLVYGTLNISNNFPTYILILMLFAIYYFICSCIKLAQKNFVITNFVYSVLISNDKKIVSDTAFLDSGNTLIDNDSNKPIFIVNFKLFSKLYKEISIENILTKTYKNLKEPHYIKSNFASGSGKILIFTVDNIKIISNKKEILINNAKLGLVYSKFNKNFNCNMLLNINAFV